MTNKAMRETMSSANSTDPNEQDQRICRARIISNAMEDEDPVDLLDTRQHEAMESTPAHSSSPLSPEETQAGNESIYSSVLRRFSLLGGSPKKSQVIPIEEHLEMTGKLEFDIEGLKRAHQNLETEFRNALVTNKRLAVECERAKEKNQTLKTVASNDTKILQDMVRVDRAAIDKLVRERNADHTQIANLRAELGATKERLHQAEYNRQRDIAHLSSTANSVSLELHAEREKARKETAQLHVQIKTINEMNDKFRQMLIPVSEKQVSDGDVAQKFTSLRSSILALVRRTWTLKLRGDVDIGLLPTGHRDFYRSRIPVSYDRLRYVVASFLYGGIFQAPNYFLRDDLQQFEAHIQMVERELFKLSPNENLKLAMDWRNASFKATEIFRGDISPFSSNLQRQIWKFFAPLKLVDATAEKAGRQKLKAICDSAAELHLMIRQLKDNFWVDNMQNAVDRPISEWGELAEEMAAVQVIDGKQPGTIAYVIAGALSKCPKENLSKVLVLEKAEVAVYRQETS